jgi:hypothetical protein
LLQIVLPDRIYRAIADGSIAWLGAGTSPARAAQTQSADM